MSSRRRTFSACSDVSEHFYELNDRTVEDITLEFFYKPHTITVLSLSVLGLVYSGFTRCVLFHLGDSTVHWIGFGLID